MVEPLNILAWLTRAELLAAVDRLGTNLPDRRRKAAIAAALLEGGALSAVFACLGDQRVRELAARSGIADAATGNLTTLREQLAARVHPPPVVAAPADLETRSVVARSPEAIAAELVWRTGRESPNGRRVLDVRPGTRELISVSQDMDAAANVIADEPPNVELLSTAHPERFVSFVVNWPFGVDALSRIKRGFKPAAMEDKWRIVTHVVPGGLRVAFLRSWTNALAFVLEMRGETGVRLLAQGDFAEPVATARAIVDGYLLNQTCVLRAPPSDGTDKLRLMVRGIQVAGRRCDYVEPATSRVWFPSDADLRVPAGFENPSCIERQLPREVIDEAICGSGIVGLFRPVIAGLQPPPHQPVETRGAPNEPLAMDHDLLAILRRWLGDVASMNERQLRSVARGLGFERNDPSTDLPTEVETSYRDVPTTRFLVWGRGELRGAALRKEIPGSARQRHLLLQVREQDGAFALGHEGWIADLVTTGADLLERIRGEGNVRGWMIATPEDVVDAEASASTLPTESEPMTPAAASVSAVQRRRRGALLGLAVGDALGAAVEFMLPGSFPPVIGYRAGGPHGLGPGEWTDDTSMALALADSLAYYGMDLADQGRRYLAWWREGKYSVNGRCFDIGITTREALSRLAGGIRASESGDAADDKSGNGSIMRLAPVAIRYLELFPGNLGVLADYAEASSAPTHRSPKCLSACRYFAVVLAALMSGRDREEVLSPDWPVLAELQRIMPMHPAILEVARGSYRRKKAPEVRGSGYVVHSLEAALWAFHDAPTFHDAVLAAVNLGDDADTTGAVCGQLAGAFFGADGIPLEWLNGLAKREWIEDAVRRIGQPQVLPQPSAADAPPSYAV